MPFDLELVLVVATILTGIFTLLEFVWLGKKRPVRIDSDGAEVRAKQPLMIEYAVSFFPVLALVLILRSFLFEPFHIPSGSMRPNLLVGDFILVNKFAYGVRLPVIHKKVIDNGGPERGDVVVFRHPVDPSKDYIKRLIGMPGDRIEYRDKQLIINGQLIPAAYSHPYAPVLGDERDMYANVFNEALPEVEHLMMINPKVNRADDFTELVPAGHYFMMGDNRDNSLDSRSWGVVPEENLVGRAMFIWMNFNLSKRKSDFKRVGTKIK